MHNHGFALVRKFLTILSRPSSLVADRATVRFGGIYPSAAYSRSWPNPGICPTGVAACQTSVRVRRRSTRYADRQAWPLSGVGNCLLKASAIGAAGQPGGRSARAVSRRRGELKLAAVTEEIRCLCRHRLHD
jgi:hypothetical protein